MIKTIAGRVEMSNQMQPTIHKMNAMIERNGDSHSKQLLQMKKKKKKWNIYESRFTQYNTLSLRTE